MANCQGLPSQFANNAHIQPVGGIGASSQILGNCVLVQQIAIKVAFKLAEFVSRHRLLMFPPDGFVRIRTGDDVFVRWRTTGFLP